MKKIFVCLVIIGFLVVPAPNVKAQEPVSIIIKEAIKKVIKAIDLKIQKLQNKTIWLQNAQKVVENTMSKLKLDEITSWVEKQRKLYKDYFGELQKVKLAITYYHKVREITELQLALVKQYKQNFEGIKKDSHFSAGEVIYMGEVYSGIIKESLQNLDGLTLVINSFTTEMTDEKRLEVIDGVKRAIQKNYDDLRSFSTQNIRLSLARAKDKSDVQVIKNLYGL